MGASFAPNRKALPKGRDRHSGNDSIHFEMNFASARLRRLWNLERLVDPRHLYGHASLGTGYCSGITQRKSESPARKQLQGRHLLHLSTSVLANRSCRRKSREKKEGRRSMNAASNLEMAGTLTRFPQLEALRAVLIYSHNDTPDFLEMRRNFIVAGVFLHPELSP